MTIKHCLGIRAEHVGNIVTALLFHPVYKGLVCPDGIVYFPVSFDDYVSWSSRFLYRPFVHYSMSSVFESHVH